MRQNQHKWPRVALGTIATERSIRAGSTDHLPILSVTKHRGFVPSLDYFKKQVFSRDTSNYKLVTQGQFAYATIHLDEGSIDYLRNFDAGLISPMYTVFEVDQAKVDPAYLLRVLKSPEMIKRYGALGQGSVNRRKSIGFGHLAKVEIPLPPLSKQQRVAEILGDLDVLIQISKEVVGQLEMLKRGAMQTTLTRGLPGRHKDFEQSELGERPQIWRVVNFGELASFRNGLNYGRQESGESIKVVGVGDFGDHFGLSDPKELGEVRVKGKVDERALLQEDDLLFVRSNGRKELVGRCIIVKFKGQRVSHSGFTIRARLIDLEALPAYVAYLFRTHHIRRRILTDGSGTNISNLSQDILSALPLLLPPLEEQQEILEVLSAFDDRIRVEQARSRQLEIVKRGLTQQLLSGELPLVPEEVPA